MKDAVGTALVTGGAKRIGRAIVEDLASHGFSVAIHANKSVAEAERLAAQIVARGGRAEPIIADLADMEAAASVVEKAGAALGPVSLLVNCASVFEDDSVLDFDWEGWDRHFAVNLKAPVLLAKTFSQALPQECEGLIVNIIDQRVWRPRPRYFSYALSKSALWSATQTMAQALAPRIRVNAIGPGPTLAPPGESDASFRATLQSLPLQRAANPEEIAEGLLFILAAQSMTGQMLALDGGQHIEWSPRRGPTPRT